MDHTHQHHHEGEDDDGYWVGKDRKRYHSHDGLVPHTHEPLDSPGYFTRRAQRLANCDFIERAFTIGIGGPVGSGKIALMLALCTTLRDTYSIAAVTNDIFTREDGEFLVKHGALPPERIKAVEIGGEHSHEHLMKKEKVHPAHTYKERDQKRICPMMRAPHVKIRKIR